MVTQESLKQAVHNIIIVDDNSELVLNTACAAIAGESLHVGVTEMFVGKNSKLTYAMVHGWNQEFDTRPKTVVKVDKNGTFISNYINLKPVKSLKTNPIITLYEGAQAYLSSIILGLERSFLDVGTTAILRGESSKVEIISRAISKDNSKLILRGEILAQSPDVKGHLECRGLQLSDASIIETIPALRSENSNVKLTHEAAVGRISEHELAYLMSRGFTEDEAVSLIVRGFVETGLEYLPRSLQRQLSVILDLIAKKAST